MSSGIKVKLKQGCLIGNTWREEGYEFEAERARAESLIRSGYAVPAAPAPAERAEDRAQARAEKAVEPRIDPRKR